MDTVKLCAAALLVAIVCAFVRQWNPSFEIPLKLAVTVVFSALVIGMALPLVRYCRALIEESAASSYLGILMTALGVSLLCETAASICRECRETTVASYVELAGRIEILVLCLPLVGEILESVRGLLSI